MTSYPAHVLANRWQQGHAVLATLGDEIIGYSSVVLVFGEATRRKMSQEIGVGYSQMPSIDLCEFATGWTHPRWRRKGISLQLRRRLLAQLGGPTCLFVSVSTGLGASPVLERLGWQIVAWGKVAFVSSLIGIPTAGLAGKIGVGWRPPRE